MSQLRYRKVENDYAWHLTEFIKEHIPWWLSGRESSCNGGDMGSIPGSERSPGAGDGNPLQYSCLGNPVGRGAWVYGLWSLRRVGHDWVTKTTITHEGFLKVKAFLPFDVEWPSTLEISDCNYDNLNFWLPTSSTLSIYQRGL